MSHNVKCPLCTSGNIEALNLNSLVRFKMKARGVEIARKHYKCCESFPNAAFEFAEPHVWCRQQLHELFRIFGGHHMGHDMDGSPIYDLYIERC